MRPLLILLAVIEVVLGGAVIRMPFINPAGVTYVDSAPRVAALPYAAAPAYPYAAAPSAYALHQARIHNAHAPIALAPQQAAYATHVKYAAPLATAYTAVPTVHHVPSHADVPVTRIEAQPGVIQKQLDIAKPAIKTRKYEIRRPAIQKQFYDIEERVIVRPAGSALVELEEPLSKTQRGEAIIRPAALPVAPLHPVAPIVHQPLARLQPIVPVRHYYPAYQHFGTFQLQQPVYGQFLNISSSTPIPPPQAPQTPQPEQPEQPQQPQQDDFNQQAIDIPQNDLQQDDDTITVDNAEISARSGQQQDQRQSTESTNANNELQSTPQPQQALQEEQQQQQPELRSFFSNTRAFPYRFENLIPQVRQGSSLVPSVRNISPELSQSNQQRLIQLLTARGGVTEVGFGRSGPSVSPVGEAGQIKARVLSATPAPERSSIQDERVNTRRVVVSRPIETLQEIEVAEPVTKLERITVNHPTLFKTARQDFVRVPTSVPVYGKALAPAFHAPYAYQYGK